MFFFFSLLDFGCSMLKSVLQIFNSMMKKNHWIELSHVSLKSSINMMQKLIHQEIENRN
jgi:hypothetical protein